LAKKEVTAVVLGELLQFFVRVAGKGVRVEKDRTKSKVENSKWEGGRTPAIQG
jgi:hypothetical protein